MTDPTKNDDFWARVAESFETGVRECFLPLAQRACLPLTKIYDGVYDVVGKNYRLRVRRGIGHGGGFLVTLSNEEVDPRDPIKIVNEIGLGPLAKHSGAAPEMAHIPSRDNSLAAYRMAARIAEEYALPYLLGSKSDYDQIEQHLRERLERSRALKKQ
jgi:hypothetical protein